MMTEREEEGANEREGDKNKSLLVLNLFFVEFSHLNGADITGVQVGAGGVGRRRGAVLTCTQR